MHIVLYAVYKLCFSRNSLCKVKCTTCVVGLYKYLLYGRYILVYV